MIKIPTHRLAERFDGDIAMLRYVAAEEEMPSIDYAHRDDYYIFMLVDQGSVRLMIDFEEYEFAAGVIGCMLPGQVHFPVSMKQHPGGWFLGVDSMLVKEEYKALFEQAVLPRNGLQPDEEVLKELRQYLGAIQSRLIPDRSPLEQSILHDLISYYVGRIAEICQKGFPVPSGSRLAAITLDFKSLLAVHYRTLKRPSEYAALLNLSPVYLNEAVKKTTGMSVSECIQGEVILQAKRMLYYTKLSIKEVALQLGYEDWAYFTRLFTKVTLVSPSQFRKQYLK